MLTAAHSSGTKIIIIIMNVYIIANYNYPGYNTHKHTCDINNQRLLLFHTRAVYVTSIHISMAICSDRNDQEINAAPSAASVPTNIRPSVTGTVTSNSLSSYKLTLATVNLQTLKNH